MSLFTTDSLALTTRDSCAVYPWQNQRPAPPLGPVLGIDHLSGRGRFAFDPWTLYERHVIRAPSMLVMGQIGNGKSTLVKTYCRRQILANRQAFVLDPKGEYGAFATLLRIPVLRLYPGGTIRVNPLDPGPFGLVNEDRQLLNQQRLALMRALLASAVSRPPTQAESNALEEAIIEQDEIYGSDLLLSHVVDAMLNPSQTMASRLVTTTDTLAREIRDGAYGLRRLVKGDLKGMFDGPTNINLTLDGNGAIIDLSAVYGQDALGPVMAAASTWLMHAISASKRKKLLVLDEAWAVLANPSVVAWLQGVNKLARSLAVSLVIVMHRISDLSSQSESSSASSKQATGFLADTETQVIFRQPDAERQNLSQVLALSSREISFVTNMPPFHALWRIGKERALVQHIVTREEMIMADTDSAMVE